MFVSISYMDGPGDPDDCVGLQDVGSSCRSSGCDNGSSLASWGAVTCSSFLLMGISDTGASAF